MESFKVIAFTHKNLSLELVGKLHLTPEEQTSLLPDLKRKFGFNELLFLSTCNRVELFLCSQEAIDQSLIKQICLFINKTLTQAETETISQNAMVYLGNEGVEHLLRVASSLDSLVVGEREIITQVRKAYEFCQDIALTGDFMRLLVKQTIETAKDVYTNTDIAKNPVSVVSLAYRQLKQSGIKNDARIVFVGSGVTNTAMAKYLQKHKFANFTVFNRTLANAEKLATGLNGNAFDLSKLETYENGFDVLIVCTASGEPVITPFIYSKLNGTEKSKKIVIDLGLPANVHEAVVNGSNRLNYIDINSLKEQAEANLQLRKNEITKCDEIIKSKAEHFYSLFNERRIELAFGEVPKQVKAIKELALNEVFAKEINLLDNQSKETLDKVLAYLEKKYNAVAIKTAKEVLLNARN